MYIHIYIYIYIYSEGQQIGNNIYNPIVIATHGKSWYDTTLLKTSEYVNRVTANMWLQKMFPTCCASLPSSVKHEMFGNRFEFGYSGDVFAPSI